MKKIVFIVSVLAVSSLILSTPAIAGCAEDLDALADAITTGTTEATGAVLQQGLKVFDDAKALCVIGDEDGAAAKIDEAKVILGLPA